MAVDFAKLGISVDTTDLKQAAADMKKVGAEGKTTGRMASQLAKDMTAASRSTSHSARQIATDMGKTAAATKDVARASRSFDMRGISMQLSQVAQQASATGRPLQALAVQLPDLALYMGGPLTIGIGAAAGALLSFVGGMGGAKTQAERFEEQLGSLADAVSTFRSRNDDARESIRALSQDYGSAAIEAQRINSVIADFAKVEAVEELRSSVEGLTETFGGLSTTALEVYSTGWSGGGGQQMYQIEATFHRLKDTLQLTDDQARAVVLSLEQLSSAEGANAQVAAAQALNANFLAAFGTIEGIPPVLRKVAEQAAIIALSAAQIDNAVQKGIGNQAALSQYVKTRLMGEREALRTASEMIAKYSQQATLYETIVAHGEASTQVAELRHQAETANLREMVEQLGVSRSVKEEIYAAADAAFAASQEAAGMAGNLGSAAAQAAALAANLGAAAVGAERQAEVGLARVNAQLSALRSGQDQAMAGARAALGIERERYVQAQKAAGLTATEAELAAKANFANREALIVANGQLRAAQSAAAATAKVATGGRRSARSLGSAARAARSLAKELTPAQKAAKELAESLTGTFKDGIGSMVDYAVDGFKGGMGGVWRIFTSTIKNMVAFALKNRIMFSLGLMEGGTGQGGGFIGGIMSKALGSWGGGTGILGGLGSVFSGFKAGGLAGMFGGIGTAMSGGLMSAVGGLMPVVGVIGLLFSAFTTKTKLLNAGLDIAIDGMNATANKFREEQKSVLFGLIRWRKNSSDYAGDEFVHPLQDAYREMQQSTRLAAAAVGGATEKLDTYRKRIRFSTKDMTPEQAKAEVQRRLQGLSDDLAMKVLGSTDFIRKGETASVALRNLGVALTAVNGALDGLNLQKMRKSLGGADLARSILDENGGAQAFASASEAYFQNFYSAKERAAEYRKRLVRGLAEKGVQGALPGSRESYRAMVERLNKLGQHQAAARAIALAPLFNEFKGLAKDATDAIHQMRGTYSLDAGRFRTEAEAKLAFEMANRGKYSAEQIDQQNKHAAEQSAILREVRDLLQRQNATNDFALARS